MSEHRLPVKVYLEDTDSGGLVYHANYLKYFERARSDILEGQGIPIRAVAHGDRLYVVHEMHIKYHRPARLGDRLEVRSSWRRASEYRITFHQEVHPAGETSPLVAAEVQVVCVDRNGNLTEMPEGLLG